MKRIYGLVVGAIMLSVALASGSATAHPNPTHGVQGSATITATSVPVWLELKSAPSPGIGASGWMRIGAKSYKVDCAVVTSNLAGTVHMLRARGIDSAFPFAPHYLLVRQGPGTLLRVQQSPTPTTLPCGAPSTFPPSPATGSFNWI